MKPFDDLKVRQAVNMAINKKRIIQIINGRAEVANQVLPPSLPGYDKDFQGYPYDPAKAKALLAEAGHPDGFSTELYATDTDPQPRIAQAIQQDLAAIGIKADIKSLLGPGGDRGRRHRGRRADDLVGRHGLDRRFPGSLRFLHRDPGLRRRGEGRLELVLVLQSRDSTSGRPRPMRW